MEDHMIRNHLFPFFSGSHDCKKTCWFKVPEHEVFFVIQLKLPDQLWLERSPSLQPPFHKKTILLDHGGKLMHGQIEFFKIFLLDSNFCWNCVAYTKHTLSFREATRPYLSFSHITWSTCVKQVYIGKTILTTWES